MIEYKVLLGVLAGTIILLFFVLKIYFTNNLISLISQRKTPLF